ncbi:MAG: ribbon-helix-helix protein, CopG family [Ilumatobacteraceae bacterium]
MSELSVVRTVRIDSDMDARIVALAAERDVTVSQFIRLTIDEVIASNERQRRLRLALQAAEQLGEIDLDRQDAWTRAADHVSG